MILFTASPSGESRSPWPPELATEISWTLIRDATRRRANLKHLRNLLRKSPFARDAAAEPGII